MRDRAPSQLTGEQHLIANLAGFPAGFCVVLFVAMVGLGWSTWPTLATATVGGICGVLALVLGFSRRNRRIAEHIQRHEGDDSWEGLS